MTIGEKPKHLTAIPIPPLMNEDLHKEDDGSHDGEEQLIQVCLQLTAITVPPYE